MRTPSFRTTVLGGLGALLLLLGAAGCGGAQSDDGTAAGTEDAAETAVEARPVPGYPAPEIIGRDVRSGETIRLSDLRGNVVMVNFFATWCPYCGEHIPAVDAFLREGGQGVRAIAVAADGTEPSEALAAYAEEHGLSFPVVYDGGVAGFTYRAFGLPTTFFVDPEGTVRFSIPGPLTPEQMAELVTRTAARGEQPVENGEETEG